MSKTAYLYRHFSEDGQLLYVGSTIEIGNRTLVHSCKAPWWENVSRIEIQKFPSRDEAMAAEKEAIKAENPQFNKVRFKIPNNKITRNERGGGEEVDPIALLNEALEGKSQADLATKIGCSQQHLSKVLNGHKAPGAIILNFLGVKRFVVYQPSDAQT